MEKIKIEDIILSILWAGSAITYSIALVGGYQLFLSDFIGLAGMGVVTTIRLVRPALILNSLLILLFVGMLNVASFVYFFNLVISFGLLGTTITPGIQIYSLGLFWVLILFRRPIVLETLKGLIGSSDSQLLSERDQRIKNFKQRFSNLSNAEIEKRLNLNLSEEAIVALETIKREREADPEVGSDN